MKFRQVICIFLLFLGKPIFILGSFSEFYKIPYLIEHYVEHNDEGSVEISFYQFLVEHYFGNHPTEDHDHSDLPFFAAHQMLCFDLNYFLSVAARNDDQSLKSHCVHLTASEYLSPILSIFLPPRLVRIA